MKKRQVICSENTWKHAPIPLLLRGSDGCDTAMNLKKELLCSPPQAFVSSGVVLDPSIKKILTATYIHLSGFQMYHPGAISHLE